jgi:ADP-ribosylglycohydrolase
MTSLDRARESLVGLSVGDALGQCFFSVPPDNVDRTVIHRLLPDAPWYYTDDTEMSLSVVSVLADFGRVDQEALAIRFANNYSYDRAYGPAMHRALSRIREGEGWRMVSQSLFAGPGSFGNGAAMRSAPIGAFFFGDTQAVIENASLAAEVTHAHSEGTAGAIAVAVAAAVACEFRAAGVPPSHEEFLERVVVAVPPSEVRSRILKAQSMRKVQSVRFPASALGVGKDMTAHDTVPFALWCCGQSLDNFEEAVWLGIEAGVDRDTIGAIIGGVVVCYAGQHRIPSEWLRRREQLPT